MNGETDMKNITFEQYYNKVYGGWIGKCIGGAAGARQEGNKMLMHYTKENIFPSEVPPNDDLDLQVLYLQEVLGKKGSFITKEDLGEAFAKYNLCICNEYAVAIRNIDSKIFPPYSGGYNNHFFSQSMGCPIRSELWGYICPANPEIAVKYASMDGCIDHVGESIYAEQFLAAIASEAFFDSNIQSLIRKGLQYIPHSCRLFECILYVIQLFNSKITWLEAREKIISKYGSCDATDCITNLAIIILSLLYGKGDFTETILIAVNCGYDTDCTAATSCALIGQILGANHIEQFWLDKIGDELVVGTVDIVRESSSIKDLALETCGAGLSLLRDRVISVNFTDIPKISIPYLPEPANLPDIEIRVEYDGIPAVGKSFNANLNAIIKNNSPKIISGILSLSTPQALSAEKEQFNIKLNGGESDKIPLTLFVKKYSKTLPIKNINTIRFNDRYPVEFGLFGAINMKLVGPFFDCYDTSKYEKDPYDEVQQKINGATDNFAIFNGYANIDKEYIDESFIDIDKLNVKKVEFSEELICPDQYINYQGPCCVYLIYDFICNEVDDLASMLIGNNCEYKLWLNNSLISRGDIAMYMPFNHACMIKLNKGLNRMIIKLIRLNTEIKFSYIFRNSHNRYRHNNNYLNVL
jgi:ADP-ribosylglycohydrolase